MSKKLRFIWIDDDITRRRSATNLAARLNVVVEFINIKKENEALQAVFAGVRPDLILIDHNLGTISSGIFKKGSTLAAYIRERWPNCPIVCITGQDIHDVDSQKRSQYEDVFEINRISNYDSTLLAIGKGYRYFRDHRPRSVSGILDLLNPPDEDIERLKAIMPSSLKVEFTDSGLVFNVSQWVRKTLLKRPGFLYDKLWASTLLGIKESSFNKVEKIFSKAKYSGIFSDNNQERWWKNSLLQILADKIPAVGMPWEKGRNLEGIKKTDYSQCFSSGEEFPEVVAFIEDTISSEQAPMRIRYTDPHKGFENLLFFDEIRIMRG